MASSTARMKENSKKPVVSYLVALYNKREFVIEALDSILSERNESFELEVCVVDDGSTDGSYEIVVNRYGRDPQFKFDRFGQNRGKNSAFNRAFELSVGDFVCLMGADDILVPGRTQLLLNEAVRSGKSVYGALVAVSADRDRTLYRKVPGAPRLGKDLLRNDYPGGVGLFTRVHARKAFPLPTNLKFEDWWISFILLRQNALSVIDETVLFYRIHGGNDSGCAVGSADRLRNESNRAVGALMAFEPYLTAVAEKYHWRRSIAFRRAVLGERHVAHAMFPYPDMYYVRTLLVLIFGVDLLYKIKSMVRRA